MQSVQFWSLAMIMVLATTAMLVVPLYWREARQSAINPWRRWEPLALAAAVPLIALSLYRAWGDPTTIGSATVPSDGIAAAHAVASSTGNRNGGDLDAAVARLRARLESNPEDVDGWRLLAQAYEFQGDTVQANAARSRAGISGGATMNVEPAPVPDAQTARLIEQAQDFRRRRDFTRAAAAFAELERRSAMNADLWADYADVLGGSQGRLDEQAARCIEAALRLDPRHVKALWLRASLQTDRREHRAALATWQLIATLIPEDSPDARIIAANLAEARSMLAAVGRSSDGVDVSAADIGSSGTEVSHPAAAVLRGDVRLDPRWRNRVTPGSVLLIYARAADQGGPPLAIWRGPAGEWPVRFSLGDGDAMIPGRRLSDFKRVVLEARVSRSGDALTRPGDLRVVSGVLDPRSAPEQRLVIAEEVTTASAARGG